MTNPLPDVIAIDGPAASGKSTIGKMIADEFGYLLLDTGCMYRALTLSALLHGLPVADEAMMYQLAQTVTIQILPATEYTDGRLYTVLLDGADVTWQIRESGVNAHVSQLSSHEKVREQLVQQQRLIGKQGQVVMVGRDIGTVVMPNASLKLYLTATAHARAHRRWQEEIARGNNPPAFETILADVRRRDEFDSNRTHSPLHPAEDAIVIDTTDLMPAEIVEKIVKLAYNHQEPSS